MVCYIQLRRKAFWLGLPRCEHYLALHYVELDRIGQGVALIAYGMCLLKDLRAICRELNMCYF